MAESPTWRRRIAAWIVLALSAGALIATSPPPPPSATLSASFAGSPTLAAGASNVTGVLTLDLSAEVLPIPDDGRMRIRGTVTFTPRNSAVRLSVRPLGVVVDEAATTLTWPIEALCRVGEPCRREFEVTLSHVGAPSPGTLGTPFDAKVEITYQEVDGVPAGATATWSPDAVLAPPTAPPSAMPGPS